MEDQFLYGAHDTIVDTTQGKIRGYQYRGIQIFKGIPYADAERFHRPHKVEPWEGVLDATSYGYVCPLMSIDKPRGELQVPHRYWPMDEHCQNLNIWTPCCDDKKRPVMFWIHGGGYFAGSSIEQVAYEGENMCIEGDVVVVSINHRLNILGYMDLSDFGEEYENSGNAGGDDIIAALLWVHDNIARFGGDPDNVILFGQSGGGCKITTLLQSPEADGLYAKAFNMSGIVGSMMEDCVGSGKDLVLAMMKELGVSDVKEFGRVPYANYVAAYQKVSPALKKEGKYIGGIPQRNSHYIGDPMYVGFRKETSKIPMLIGSVFAEFTGFALSQYDKKSMSEEEQISVVKRLVGDEGAEELLKEFRKVYPYRAPMDALNVDFIFRAPAIAYLKKRTALNDCTYSYLFDLDQPINGGNVPWHCSDIPYVFHNTCLVPSTQNPGVTGRLEKEIFDSVMAFARTGKPCNPSVPEWKNSRPDAEFTMIFDEHTHTGENFDHTLIEKAQKIIAPHLQEIMQDAQIQH